MPDHPRQLRCLEPHTDLDFPGLDLPDLVGRGIYCAQDFLGHFVLFQSAAKAQDGALIPQTAHLFELSKPPVQQPVKKASSLPESDSVRHCCMR